MTVDTCGDTYLFKHSCVLFYIMMVKQNKKHKHSTDKKKRKKKKRSDAWSWLLITELSAVNHIKTTTEMSLFKSRRPVVNCIIYHHRYTCSPTM